MRIFNEDKTQEITEFDLEKGYLVDDEIKVEHAAEVVHHDAVAHVEGKGHYETIREYPNGGKDVKWVVDVPYVEGHEAYDEVVREAYYDMEQIKVYIPYPESYWEEKRAEEERLKRKEEESLREKERLRQEEEDKKSGKTDLLNELADLKEWLSDHDYVGTKIATGRATVEEYANIIAEMTEKANRINEIDELLKKL